MADLPLRNRYKAYKEGTENLVRWVTRKASRYSNSAEYLCTLAGPDCGATTLTARDPVTLTKLVVANDVVEIPENILNITQDVAAERQVCANWYKDQNKNGELTASDITHAYFIGILHEVYDILHSARASQKQDNPRPPQQTSFESIPCAFNNSFQHLKVEEPVDNPLGTTTGTAQGFTAADKLTFRLEKQKGDNAFAVWSLLEDFSAVKKYITSVWRDYKAGRKTLLAAGAITDTAFGLMRHANEDFAKSNNEIANCQDMLAFLEGEMLVPTRDEMMERAHAKGETVKGKTKQDEHTQDENASKTMGKYKLFEVQVQEILLYREAGQLFETLTRALQRNLELEKKAPMPPSSCNSVNESPLGVFGHTLLQLSYTIQQCALINPVVHSPNNNRLSLDEFLSAMMNHAIHGKPSEVPIWLAAATQCYQDIHDVLNGVMSCGNDAFLSYLHRIRPMAKRGQLIISADPANDRPNGREKIFERLASEEWSNAFDFTEYLGQVAGFENRYFTFKRSTASLAHFLPLYPCCYNFRVHYKMQFHSIQFLGSSRIVLSMAHLYKAGQEYGIIKSAWKDMDFVLANHVSYKPGRPGTQPIVATPRKRSDPFEMAALFRAALGVPTPDLDKAVRPRLPDIANSWRRITYQSDLMTAMEETQREVSHLKVSDREHVNIVLRKLSDAENKSNKKGRTTTKYTLVELLETCEKHLTAAEPILTFDYIGFIDICAQHLREFNDFYHRAVRRGAPPHELEIWDLVDCLLWTAADVVKKSQHQSPEELHRTLLKTKFGRACTDLGQIIDMSGSVCYNDFP
jgi:hypothetical protein